MSASSVPMDVVRQATTRCPPATHILAELPYLPSAVPQARHVLREGMRLASIPEDVRSTAELLVSELVTNAVKYGEPPLWLFIEMRPGLIHASVSDTSTVLPQRRTADADAEGGRGLLVLDALAGSWGTVAAESGKYLWFDLPVPPLTPDASTPDPTTAGSTTSGSTTPGSTARAQGSSDRSDPPAAPREGTTPPQGATDSLPDQMVPPTTTPRSAPAPGATDYPLGGARPGGTPPVSAAGSPAAAGTIAAPSRPPASFSSSHSTLFTMGGLSDPARSLTARPHPSSDPRGSRIRPGRESRLARDAQAGHGGRDNHDVRDDRDSLDKTTEADPTIVTRLL
ncbi:ATP-binding protein [Frankia sp. AgPm24]|uniref:ATP-binding protein n=1 Tax=Frankia sp. AgPm24 TaxID=631128 RepID=UPI00200C9758|nr:ATP-binding protein [Frankia sp. AgPm24]MCK9920981.1 ATP-binding protein [Frankia sp. AgPm24]